MSNIDQTIYSLFAQMAVAGLPLSAGLFADGETGKHALIAMLRAELRRHLPLVAQHGGDR